MIKLLWLGFGLLIAAAIQDGAWPTALFLFAIVSLVTWETLK